MTINDLRRSKIATPYGTIVSGDHEMGFTRRFNRSDLSHDSSEGFGFCVFTLRGSDEAPFSVRMQMLAALTQHRWAR